MSQVGDDAITPTVHSTFNFPDADFTIHIEYPEGPHSYTPRSKIAFRVHKAKLAAASPVFADMLAIGSAETIETSARVDEIALPAHSDDVWVILLGSMYNDFDLLSEHVFDSQHTDNATLLAVWSASHKYQLATLFRLCENCVK
jgi:hypothetical protein